MAGYLRCLLLHSTKFAAFKKSAETLSVLRIPCINTQVQIRNCNSIAKLDLTRLPDFEVSKDPKEWEYVEKLFKPKCVPPIKYINEVKSSGWVAPREEAKSLPYFIPRTKNHMEPVYLEINNRGLKHTTLIKRIHGNIWQLEKELREYLEGRSTKFYKHIASQVNEMNCQLRFRGDYVSEIKAWMHMKGF